ncbi:MAG: flagellar protein FlgN [Reinekea sp.]|jgi:flagellar biosynthesis/type III secretory pathway chaperone
MNTDQLNKLHETLRASIVVAQEFSELLKQEKHKLTSLDRDDVTSLLEQKELLIHQLIAYQGKILQFCQEYKLEPNYSDIRAYLFRTGVKNAEAILQDWTILKNALIKNQALNKTNEAILAELIRRNQIKQTIIQGLGKQADTYTAKGSTAHHSQQGWVEQV